MPKESVSEDPSVSSHYLACYGMRTGLSWKTWPSYQSYELLAALVGDRIAYCTAFLRNMRQLPEDMLW